MTTDKNKRLFQVTAEDFKKIPGSPISYWMGEKFRASFSLPKLSEFAEARVGMATGRNEYYLRIWPEVSVKKVGFSLSRNSAKLSKLKWFPYNKGGEFRRWYGNREFVVNWFDDGFELQNTMHPDGTRIWAHNFILDKIFKMGISWTVVSSGMQSFRFTPEGCLFDAAAGVCQPKQASIENVKKLILFFNTKVADLTLKFINPTINLHPGYIESVPYGNCADVAIFDKIFPISKADYDSYETSWDFQSNPLIQAEKDGQCNGRMDEAYLTLLEHQRTQCEEMRKLEIENNRIFIDAYGLQEELSSDVPWNEITLTCNPWYRYGKTPSSVDSGQWIVDRAADTAGNGAADAAVDSGQWIVDRAAGAAVDSEQWIVDSEECHIGDELQIDEAGNVQVLGNTRFPASKMPFNQELETRLLTDTIKELLSYAVGCMFGRYSLDVDGLAYAGGEWDDSKYTTFPADADNIIPICDDDYFEDDLTGRFVKFIETVYGTETLEENLNFIAHALGGRGSAREVIRNYFRNNFFEDHCKIYQKRPIYWLFDSGKKGGFRALIYMHRYQPDTIAKLRVDYVHEQQERYRTAIADLAPRVDNASGSEKVKLAKRLTALRDQAEEVRLYEEKIHHLADRMVSIDLDDGVKHNYAIFQDVLARIK